ncbi:hypothetical protein EDB92DRAFT_1815046 [Lactarius akahatsu]|uniref:C2H2-type domain-containing protein n=1 Tax=Lactarius akahatsu TaxID=416441 RepID=A0AAD4LML8_9AGAM|nr:hypothetical protein EDB92DRAFT_1815046 [Lactarius akahatsu]
MLSAFPDVTATGQSAEFPTHNERASLNFLTGKYHWVNPPSPANSLSSRTASPTSVSCPTISSLETRRSASLDPEQLQTPIFAFSDLASDPAILTTHSKSSAGPLNQRSPYVRANAVDISSSQQPTIPLVDENELDDLRWSTGVPRHMMDVFRANPFTAMDLVTSIAADSIQCTKGGFLRAAPTTKRKLSKSPGEAAQPRRKGRTKRARVHSLPVIPFPATGPEEMYAYEFRVDVDPPYCNMESSCVENNWRSNRPSLSRPYGNEHLLTARSGVAYRSEDPSPPHARMSPWFGPVSNSSAPTSHVDNDESWTRFEECVCSSLPSAVPTQVTMEDIQTHTSPPKLLYACPLCPRDFRLPNGLALHLKWHDRVSGSTRNLAMWQAQPRNRTVKVTRAELGQPEGRHLSNIQSPFQGDGLQGPSSVPAETEQYMNLLSFEDQPQECALFHDVLQLNDHASPPLETDTYLAPLDGLVYDEIGVVEGFSLRIPTYQETMTTTLPSSIHNHHESPSTPGLEIPGAFPREHTSTTRQRTLSGHASDRISLPSTEKEGTHPGEHCGGVGSLPGTISETSVAKLPDERASEGKAVPAPPSRSKELAIDTDHGDEAVVPTSSSVAKVPDERASEGRAASEPASRPKELVVDTGDDVREDVVAPATAPASYAAPGVTEQDSPVRRPDPQGPSAVGEQVPAERGAETEGTADSKFKEELRKEGKSSGAIDEGTRQPPLSRAAAVEDPAPPKGGEEDPNKAAVVQQQQQQLETAGGPATRKGRSSSDSDAGNQAKATIMNRVKGEMKVLLGKASKNRDKVEEGERLKHGAHDGHCGGACLLWTLFKFVFESRGWRNGTSASWSKSIYVDDSRFPFLSIPLDDVQRLSIRPFKWLRYVLYSICGARGNLYARLGDPPVDYDSTELADHLIYFYEPSGKVSYCITFRGLSKTDHPFMAAPMIRSIDAIENGVLLVVDLHRKLGRGDVAFLKTPNYGLDPTDIPRVESSDRQGPVPADHFTLHRLKLPPGYDQTTAAILESTGKLRPDIAFTLGLNVDALFRSTDLLPAAIILDYVYGIAAYEQWNSKRDDKAVHGVIGNYRNEHYVDNPATSPSPPTDNYEDEVHDPTNVAGNLVDCHDPDHAPTTSSRYTSTRTGDEMAKAMDDLNAVLMLVRGITPEEAAKRRERRMEEDLKAQEASRSKVMEWMRTTAVGSS